MVYDTSICAGTFGINISPDWRMEASEERSTSSMWGIAKVFYDHTPFQRSGGLKGIFTTQAFASQTDLSSMRCHDRKSVRIIFGNTYG